jgi:hypothetical protein
MTNAAQLENFFNVETKTGLWRKKTLDYLQSIYPAGAITEDIAKAINEPEDDIQPRTSELSACDRDYIRGLGRGENSKTNPVTVWYFNPEPKPKPKKMKPVGDKVKWGEMIRTAYAYKAHPVAHNLHSMNRAAMDWIMDFSNTLDNSHRKDVESLTNNNGL